MVIIAATIASIATVKLGAITSRAGTNAARASLATMQRAVEQYEAEHGQWPVAIDPLWFVDRRVPANTAAPGERRLVNNNAAADSGKLHPTVKAMQSTPPFIAAWWYNPHNGTVRARVREHADAAETLASYNDLNGTSITSLIQID